jgi:hypothetical protein
MMNKKQWIIFLAGVCIIALMIFIPPWKTVKTIDLGKAGYASALRGSPAPEVGYEESVVYASVFSPPDSAGENKKERFLASMGVFRTKVTLNFSRLIIQIAIVSLITGMLCFIFRSPSQ